MSTRQKGKALLPHPTASSAASAVRRATDPMCPHRLIMRTVVAGLQPMMSGVTLDVVRLTQRSWRVHGIESSTPIGCL